jgi:hypothetical protein
MAFVTLQEAKDHLRVDGDDENLLIQLKLDAAEEQAVAYLQRNVYADQTALDNAVTAETAGERPMVVNASLKAAILLIVGHLYRNREDVGAQASEIPFGARDLLAPFRIHWGA